MGPGTRSKGPESQTPPGGLLGQARRLAFLGRLTGNQVLRATPLVFLLCVLDGFSIALLRGHVAGLSVGYWH